MPSQDYRPHKDPDRDRSLDRDREADPDRRRDPDSSKAPEKPEPPRSAAFLAAFNRAERALRARAGETIPFRQLISQTRRRHAVVRRYHDDLVELSELRNAIVHDSVDPAVVIAEPSPAAVELMQRVADMLERPPELVPLFQREVALVLLTHPLRAALDLMVANDYSQLPVYDEQGRLTGLLTERRIARWYARGVVEGTRPDPGTPVAAVLAEPGGRDVRNYAVMNRDATVFDAEEKFVNNHELEAIIITATGRPNDKPIGIATAGDMARRPSG